MKVQALLQPVRGRACWSDERAFVTSRYVRHTSKLLEHLVFLLVGAQQMQLLQNGHVNGGSLGIGSNGARVVQAVLREHVSS